MRGTRMAVGLAVAVVGAGCLNTTGPGSNERTSAAVSGQVTRADGVTGVGGSAVTIQLLTAPAGGTQRFLVQGNVLADDNGRFLILFLLREPIGNAEANIAVTPAPGTGLLPRDTNAIAVKILPGEIPAESTHVQIPLQAR